MKKTRFSMLMLAILILSCSHAGAEINLSFVPVNPSVETGDPFDLDIVISGLDAIDLSTFEFDIAFDDSLLDFNSYTLGDELGDIALFEADDYSSGNYVNGLINLLEVSYLGSFPSQPSSFTLATLSFTGASTGTGLFSIQGPYGGPEVILGDEFGDPPADDVVLMDAQFEIRPQAPPLSGVPEPGTFILISLGMAWAAFMGRRNK